jgi:small-conductance mechanosensitive channel
MILENLLTGGEVHWQLARFTVTLVAGLALMRIILVPLVDRFVSRRSDSVETQASLKNFIEIFTGFIVFTMALQAGNFGGLVTVVGTITAALTVAIGFGMRDEVGSLVSGVFIQLDNPFVKGDYIKVQDTEGVIRDIGLRMTTLKTTGSEKLLVPNRILTGNSVKNFTRGRKTKTSVAVKPPVESVEKARKILKEKTVENDEALENPEPDTLINGLDDGKAEVELHYWVNSPEKVSMVRSQILEKFTTEAREQKIFESEEEE